MPNPHMRALLAELAEKKQAAEPAKKTSAAPKPADQEAGKSADSTPASPKEK